MNLLPLRSPLQAMIWELWRTNRKEWLIRMLALLGLVFFFYFFPIASREDSPEAQVVAGIFVMVMTISCGLSQSWVLELDRQNRDRGFRLSFVRPVSALQIVAVPFLFSMLIAVVSYLAPALLFYLVVNAQVPICGPLVVLIAGTPCILAATWGPATLLGKALSIAGLLLLFTCGVVWYEHSRESATPWLMAIGDPDYFNFDWRHYALLAAAAPICFAITVAGVKRQRCGEYGWIGIPLVANWFVSGAHRTQPTQKRLPTFRSPLVAQCWYEMRRFGPTVLLMGVLAPLVLFAIATLIGALYPQTRGSHNAWLVALAICPGIYQLVGIDGALGLSRKQGEYFFPAFDAARPLTNDQLIFCKLVVVAALSLLGLAVMGLAAAVHGWIGVDQEGWRFVGGFLARIAGDSPWYWWLLGICNAILLYNASSSMLLTLGLWAPKHGFKFVGLLLFTYLQAALAVWDGQNGWSLHLFWQAEAYILATIIVVLSVVILRKAFLAGVLSGFYFKISAGLWIAYVVSAVLLYLRVAAHYPAPVVLQVLGAAALLGPLTASALAPLSLAATRHA